MGFFSNLLSNPIETIGNAGQKVIDNPIPAITAFATNNPAALLAYGAPTPSAGNAQSYGNILQGGLSQYGGMVQSQASKDAIQAAQNEARRAGQQASAMAQFRPIGITTRFGSSQFQVDPTTGQLVSAGYTSTPELAQAQNRLMGLGAGYLSKTPEEVAQEYIAKQYDLLAPSRERQLAELRNRQFQTGREGLSVGATGIRPGGGLGLKATNPEMEAYYNALAQQDAELAAKAMQAGQQQVGFGAGLFGKAGELETLAQQPLSLSSDLAKLISSSGATAGGLGLRGGLSAAEIGVLPQLQYSPTASLIRGITSPTSTLGQGIGGLFGSFFGGNAPITNIGDTSAFDYAYGGGGFY